MKYPSFRVSRFQTVIILDYVYGLPFHAVVVFRPKIDFLFKSASTYCTAAHDNNANPAAASCKSALRSKLYIPSTINIWKKVLTKAIWADKKWAGFWQISL